LTVESPIVEEFEVVGDAWNYLSLRSPAAE